jgi:hypothetical protein
MVVPPFGIEYQNKIVFIKKNSGKFAFIPNNKHYPSKCLMGSLFIDGASGSALPIVG